jgi:hypothetical protein
MLLKKASESFRVSAATSGLGSSVLVEHPGGAPVSFAAAPFSKENETK